MGEQEEGPYERHQEHHAQPECQPLNPTVPQGTRPSPAESTLAISVTIRRECESQHPDILGGAQPMQITSTLTGLGGCGLLLTCDPFPRLLPCLGNLWGTQGN